MTLPQPSFSSAPLARMRRARVAAIVVALTATLSACSPSVGEEPANSGSQPAATADESTGDEGTPDAPEADGYTSDDVGNATLRINGVEFPDFTGDCEISRQHGKEDVGDLNTGDISAIIGIDNTKAHEDTSMNYIAINEERFRFRDLVGAAGVGNSAKGEINTLTELGPRTADGSRDIVEVRFAGTFEDGTSLEADVVCELQNTF